MKAAKERSIPLTGSADWQQSPELASSVGRAIPLLLLLGLGILMAVIVSHDLELGAQVVPTVFLTLIAFGMAAFNSRWLVVYILCVYVFAPELRRVIDWEFGRYHSITLLSIAPVLCNAALLLPILRHPYGLPRQLRIAVTLFIAALVYAGGLGLLLHGATALYEAAVLLLPIMLIPYMALRPLEVRERDQWLSALVTIGVVVAAYGWVQFVTAPPWDMFWLTQSGMTSSGGDPQPLEFRVFSTINSTGPAAWFLSFTVAVAFLNSRWRGPFGWAGIFLMVSALAITEVRSGWVAVLVLIATYTALSAGAARWRLLAGILLLGIILSVALPSLPGGEKTLARMQTLNNLNKDNSANARTTLTANLVPVLLSNPLGKGTGSTGVGGKLDQDEDKTAGNGSFDNGIFALILTFGFLGSVAFFYAFWLLVRTCFVLRKAGNIQLHARLGQAVSLTVLVLLCFNNGLVGIGGYVIWLLMGSAFGRTGKEI